jgi:hypothetical protein
MSSTRKTSEYPSPAYNLPTGEEAAEAAEGGIEVAEAALGLTFGGAVAAAAAVEAAAVEGADGATDVGRRSDRGRFSDAILGTSSHLAGWLAVEGSVKTPRGTPVTTGPLNMEALGTLSGASFYVEPYNLNVGFLFRGPALVPDVSERKKPRSSPKRPGLHLRGNR